MLQANGRLADKDVCKCADAGGPARPEGVPGSRTARTHLGGAQLLLGRVLPWYSKATKPMSLRHSALMRTKLHVMCMCNPLYTHGMVKLKTPFVTSVRRAWMLGTVPLCNVASVHCSNQLVLLLFIVMAFGQASAQFCIAALANSAPLRWKLPTE